MRTEHDYLGSVEVPADKYWGPQTERAKNNFSSITKIPTTLIAALALVKKAACTANLKLNELDQERGRYILLAIDEILDGKLFQHFPLGVWQSGSGTQTNMNMNEVISTRANELAESKHVTTGLIHPNDHVNLGQSSNDTIPTAIHLASHLSLHNLLLALKQLEKTLKKKIKQFSKITKVGRTHLQDAVHLTLGEEFSAFLSLIQSNIAALEASDKHLRFIAQGGTALGSSINTHKNFPKLFASELSSLVKTKFYSAKNKFAAISSDAPILELSGQLNSLASNLIKIGNDIKLLSSGPKCGIGELLLPVNEPGSSIMPGKINPTQIEALLQVCFRVIGNHTAITIANSFASLQLSVSRPMLSYCILESLDILEDSISLFTNKCLSNITCNKKKIEFFRKTSLEATSLTKELGYDMTSKIVRYALENNLSIKQAKDEMKK